MLPANEGRGYVLRRIMRRAMRHAHLLGAKEPLMYRLVPALVAEMGAAYPELVRAQPLIEATLQQEETRFRQTLANGLKLLDEATADLGEGGTLPGETAFKLYDTYGFPYDLTEDALRARGLEVDRAGFDAAMAEQKAAGPRRLEGLGRQGVATTSGSTSPRSMARPSSPAIRATKARAWSLAIVKDGARVDSAEIGETVEILLNQTPFYGESGGQIGDTGKLTTLKGFEGEVEDTSKPLGKLHALRTKVVEGRAVGRRHGPPDGRRRAPRPRPRQPQRDPPAPRGAAPAARHACHPEGQPGRAGLFPLRFLAPQGADPRGDRGGRGRGERPDPLERAGRRPG